MRQARRIAWLLLLLTLVACGSGSAEEPTRAATATSPPTAVAAVASATAPATDVPPTATATTAPPTATLPPTETPAPTLIPVSNCVTCHEDKEMLINTAASVEEPDESESSGPG